MSNSLALWKITNEEDAVKNKARSYAADFFTRNILERIEPLCRHSIDFCLLMGHSDITRFLLRSPIATGNILDRTEKIRISPLTFLIHVQAFRDPLRGELPHVQIFMKDEPNPLT